VADVLYGLLCLAPAIALTIPLVLGRYPGQRLIVATTARPRRQLPRPAMVLRPLHEVTIVVRGGLLIGRCLAVRPPPAPLLADR
jgi:hypothetical protein